MRRDVRGAQNYLNTWRHGDTGRFIVQYSIGEGAQGSVFKVTDRMRETDVAIKIAMNRGPTINAHFERQARVLGMHQPGLIGVYEVLKPVDMPPALVMKLGDRSLENLIADTATPFDEAYSLKIAEQFLTGLASLHTQYDIVHRDLKPANIIMVDETANIADLGLIGSAGKTTDPRGTLEYRAPELFQRGRLTPGADVYSAALIIVASLTGKTPFSQNDDEESGFGSDVYQDSTERALWELKTSFNPEQDLVLPNVSYHNVLIRALQQKPEARYANAQEFLDALREARTVNPKSQTHSLENGVKESLDALVAQALEIERTQQSPLSPHTIIELKKLADAYSVTRPEDGAFQTLATNLFERDISYMTATLDQRVSPLVASARTINTAAERATIQHQRANAIIELQRIRDSYTTWRETFGYSAANKEK